MQARVAEIIKHVDDVYQVTFVPEKPLPQFKAGQFLHLALDAYDPCGGLWPESRAFSIASSWGRGVITIVYSVRGSFTNRMKNELAVDKMVWLRLPYGSFIVGAYDQQQDVVLVAGGTGVAPFVPYLEEELQQPSGRKIYLSYGIRDEQCFLFKDLMQKCCQDLPGFTMDLFSGKPIDFEQVGQRAGGMNNPLYFISGPRNMLTSLRDFLIARGIAEDKVLIDDWGL